MLKARSDNNIESRSSIEMTFFVRQVIEPNPLTVTPATSLEAAIALMSQAQTSYVLIVEGDCPNCSLLGIFTERDVVRLVASGVALYGMAIADVMTQPLITLRESDAQDIFDILSLYQQHQIRHIPIVDDRANLIGIVTPEMICSELRQAHQQTTTALQKSEANYRELVEHANSIILRTDRQGNITFFNEFAQKLFGYKAEEILGKNAIETIFSQTYTSGRTSTAMLREILKHPDRYAQNESESILQNGERVWIAWTNKAILDADGNLTEILSIGNDISDRVKAEKALQASQRMLRLVMDNIPQAIFWKNCDSVYLGSNRKFARDLGYESPEEIIGKTDYDLCCNREQADWFCQIDRHVIQTNTPEYRIVEPFSFADGKQAWLETNKIPLHDECDNVVGILCTYDDITDRKQIEEALIESETKFRFLFERSADAFLLMDGDRFIDCNQTAVNMMRATSKEQLLNRHPSELSPQFQPDGRSSFEKSSALNALALSQGNLRFEWVHRRIDGEDFPVEVLLTAIPLQGQKILYVVWRDISARKAVEASLLSSERRLRRQSRALLDLANRKTLVSGDLQAALREITEVATRTLEVDRASVWLYNEDGSAIICLDLYQRSDRLHSSGMELLAIDYPGYFRALSTARIIAAHDAHSDRRTHEFSEVYLNSLGITSMLDAPIRLGGQMIGVICHEHIGPPRRWALEEENFASSLADFVALAMEGVERRRVEEALQKAKADLEIRVEERTAELTNAIAQLQNEIASREQAEEKLRLIQSAVQQTNEAVAITTADLNAPGPQIVYLNPAFTTITGYTIEEAMGKTPRILQGPKTDRAVLDELRQALDRGESFFGELVNYCKGRQEYVVELNITPIRNSNGQLTHFVAIQRDITERKLAEENLRIEQEKSERLLLNILPGAIAHRLKQQQSTIADGFASVTVLFADIVNFTQLSERISPTALVELLNEIFSAFDDLSDRHSLEKIKTIGDAYMVAGGLPMPMTNHAEAVAEMALDMQREVARFNAKHNTALAIRIGINTGPVVAGVIGIKKFIYDLWGDTVNTASRMESHGVADSIHVTEATYELLREKYIFEERGIIQVKGKGEMTTYLLTGKKVSDRF